MRILRKEWFFKNCICILMTIQDFKKKTIYAESKFHHGPQKIEELKSLDALYYIILRN